VTHSTCTQEEVLAALGAILATGEFSRSESLSRLLEHVVTSALAGHEDELKEYNLGVQVFRRGRDFDPRLDNIVRVQARKLRSRLAEYYATPRSGVRIEMTPGSYVPVFYPILAPAQNLKTEEETPYADAEPKTGRRWRFSLWATIGATTAAAFLAGFICGRLLEKHSEAIAIRPSLWLTPTLATAGDPLELRAGSTVDGMVRDRLSLLAAIHSGRAPSARGFTLEGSARRTGSRITVQLNLSGGTTTEDRGLRFAITAQDDTTRVESLAAALVERMSADFEAVLKSRAGGDWPWSRAKAVADARLDFLAAADQLSGGAWSYGWERQMSGPLYPYPRSFRVMYWGVGVFGWSQSGEGPENGQHCCPFVARNISGQDVREQIVEIPTGKLFFHPGPKGEYSVVRWKNKDAGHYTVEGRFSTLAYASVDVHAIKNGVPLVDGWMDGRRVWHDFLIRALPCDPDEVIDFAVGFGSDHSYHSDITGLDARILPE